MLIYRIDELVFCSFGIGPQAFQAIEFAHIVLKYVYHYVHVIYQRPFVAMLYMVGTVVALLLHGFVYIVRNGFYLGIRPAIAQHKEVGHCLVDLSEVEHYNVLAFFILNATDDRFE